MEGKKISFGFMKTKKTEKPIVEEKKEYIDCVEEKSIRIVGGETVKDAAPLIIPMKPNTLVTTERLKQIAEEVESAVSEQPEPGGETKVDTDVNPGENETLDQMAVRELVQDAKKQSKTVVQALTVPVPVQPILDGHKESTMEDYESVPIQQFGLAMLRGMGWTPGNEKIKYKEPQLRPKGLGLGADKVIKDNQKKNESKDKEEELSIVKNAFVKITSGKYGGCYGKVLSLDEDNGRVMVDISVKKETVSLSEFMMLPVTRNEFDKQSRVINADTYEEYKRKEQMSSKSSKLSDKDSQKVSERESSSNRKSHEQKRHESNRNSKSDDVSNGKNREKYRANSSSSEETSCRDKRKNKRRDLSSSEERAHRVKEKPRTKYTSDESSSDSGSHKRKHKKNQRKAASPDLKRDIDKKRKGKKKKRDRDRSPNYKKHRK